MRQSVDLEVQGTYIPTISVVKNPLISPLSTLIGLLKKPEERFGVSRV